MQDDEDIDIDAQIKKNLWKNHRLLPPDHQFVRIWFSGLMVLVMVSARESRSLKITRSTPCKRSWPQRPDAYAGSTPCTQYNAVYIPIELCFEEQLGKKHVAHIVIGAVCHSLLVTKHTALPSLLCTSFASPT